MNKLDPVLSGGSLTVCLTAHRLPQTQEEQLQEQRVEKMMRAAAKEVHKIRGQSRKEGPEVQSFR